MTIRFLPAPNDHGIAFQRTDLPHSVPIPAVIGNVISRSRRTILQQGEARVELIEHVMAALAGLKIDNCLVQLDAAEPPGGDGSATIFTACLDAAGILESDPARRSLGIDREFEVISPDGSASIQALPTDDGQLRITYELDYGGGSPIPQQSASYTITPAVFQAELAFCRTFILEQEIEALKAQGLGSNTTAKDLIVFQHNGDILGNTIRVENECARHKLLDCIGDFALAGVDLHGHFIAKRSGHQLNHQIIEQITNHYGLNAPARDTVRFKDAA